MKSKRQKIGIIALIVIALVLISLNISAEIAGKLANNKLTFGEEKNLLELSEIERVYQENTLKTELFRDIDIKIPLSCVSIYPALIDGYSYLKIEGLYSSAGPGAPRLPMKTEVLELPLGAQVSGVEVIQGTYREIEEELKIVPNSQPRILREGLEKKTEITPEPSIYAADKYFPGNLVSFDAGSDGKITKVYARFFPVQYNPKQKKAILVTQVTLRLYYFMETKAPLTASGEKSQTAFYTEAQSLIITSSKPGFEEAAWALAEFHNSEGIPSEVVLTDWIRTNYPPAPDPPYYGYAHEQPSRLSGYNYVLAKRIISFLRDTEAHPNLKYITLLGDGVEVPESYYARPMKVPLFDSLYYSWTPTDFLYASPDYDLVPNYRVGRLSAQSLSEAKTVVKKIIDWYNHSNWNWFKNVSVAGGNTFYDRYFYGEISTNEPINRGWLDHMDLVEKYFCTNGLLNKDAVQEVFTTGNLGFYYHYDHGCSCALYASRYGLIYASELLNYAPVSEVPIVISPACGNALFDLGIIKARDWGMFCSGEDKGFGEGVLLSPATGIAYFGTVRAGYDGTEVHFEDGELIIDSMAFSPGIFNNILRQSSISMEDLGELYQGAISFYVLENDMRDPYSQNTLVNFALLGDPALKLPQIGTSSPNYDMPRLRLLGPPPEGYNEFDMPYYYEDEEWITVNANTFSPSVRYKLVGTQPLEPDLPIVSDWLYDSTLPFDYQFTPFPAEPTSPYFDRYFDFVRCEAEDGREGRFYVEILDVSH